MPTDKEIEIALEQVEALDFDNEWGIEHITDEAAHVLRDAYLSMKAERDKYKEDCALLIIEKQHKQNCYDNLKESARQNDIELNKEIDKYKTIVEADTGIIRWVRESLVGMPAIFSEDGLLIKELDKALALRENKEE